MKKNNKNSSVKEVKSNSKGVTAARVVSILLIVCLSLSFVLPLLGFFLV